MAGQPLVDERVVRASADRVRGDPRAPGCRETAASPARTPARRLSSNSGKALTSGVTPAGCGSAAIARRNCSTSAAERRSASIRRTCCSSTARSPTAAALRRCEQLVVRNAAPKKNDSRDASSRSAQAIRCPGRDVRGVALDPEQELRIDAESTRARRECRIQNPRRPCRPRRSGADVGVTGR